MNALRSVALIGAGNSVLYATVYLAQRAMSPPHAHGSLRAVAALYGLATLGIFLIYAAIIRLASKGQLRDRRARVVAFGVPILLSIALTIGRPSLSIDVLTYVAQGHQARAGQNPYSNPVKAVASTPFGADLQRQGWIPVHGVSPYGPLWTELEAGVGWIASDVATQALVLKIVVTGFSLGCAFLIWLILGDVSPPSQVVGTLLYLWNPVVIAEFAGEGHNDAVMLFFLLLSLLLWIRGRHGASALALGVGALVKVVALIIAPLGLVYAWRVNRDRRRFVGSLVLGTSVAATMAAAAYAPLWIGLATFDGLRSAARPSILASTPGVLYWYLTRSHSEDASARVLSLLMTAGLIGYMALMSTRARDSAGLVRACGRTALVYLMLAPGYWPWYATMPIALMALAPTDMFILSIFAVSLASRLAAPIDALRLDGLMDWESEVFRTTIVGIWFPAAVIGVFGAWMLWKSSTRRFPQNAIWHRTDPSYEQAP